jgi:hypothetical protein
MQIVDIDEFVPDDISFKYRDHTYTIPGDLRTDQTLELYAMLKKLAETEGRGDAGELDRIVKKAEKALLPVFQVHQPEMTELPFGAVGLGVVLQTVLRLIGLLDGGTAAGEGEQVDPPNRSTRRRQARSTPTPTSTGSRAATVKKKPAARRKPSAGSTGSKK